MSWRTFVQLSIYSNSYFFLYFCFSYNLQTHFPKSLKLDSLKRLKPLLSLYVVVYLLVSTLFVTVVDLEIDVQHQLSIINGLLGGIFRLVKVFQIRSWFDDLFSSRSFTVVDSCNRTYSNFIEGFIINLFNQTVILCSGSFTFVLLNVQNIKQLYFHHYYTYKSLTV